jgi:CheY-like chemotaxis protein
MKDLVLVDPRAQRARLFGEAIHVYRQRSSVVRAQAGPLRAAAGERREHSSRLLRAMNRVAADRCTVGNGEEVSLHVFQTVEPALEYLRALPAGRRAVVFSDVYRHGTSLSGIDLVACMKREAGLRCVPTVLLATDASELEIRKAWRAGCSAVVHLPLELPGMLVRVTDAVEFWFRTAAL